MATAMAGERVVISEVSIDDDAALARFVAFENERNPGRVRTVVDRRAFAARCYGAIHLVAERAGTIVALLVGTVQDVDAGRNLQLHVLVEPGSEEAIAPLVERVAGWSQWVERTEAFLVSATDPSTAELQAWRDLGFEDAGARIAWSRAVAAHERIEVLEVDGVEVVELASRPELLRSAHEAWLDAYAAIPDDVVSGARPGFEQWLAERLEDSGGELAPSFLVAVDAGDRVVGVGYLVPHGAGSTTLGHRFTGVVSDWRGRGVARLLKQEQIAWAARNGFTELRCTNHEGNHAMLHVNEVLGYERTSTIVMLRRPHSERSRELRPDGS